MLECGHTGPPPVSNLENQTQVFNCCDNANKVVTYVFIMTFVLVCDTVCLLFLFLTLLTWYQCLLKVLLPFTSYLLPLHSLFSEILLFPCSG